MSTKKATKKKWETLDISDPEPEPIKINFSSQVEYGGKVYTAGGTFLDVLGQRHVPYVGMIVQEDGNTVAKLIEMDEAAHRFLVVQGLPMTVAKALVTMAAAVRDERA